MRAKFLFGKETINKETGEVTTKVTSSIFVCVADHNFNHWSVLNIESMTDKSWTKAQLEKENGGFKMIPASDVDSYIEILKSKCIKQVY